MSGITPSFNSPSLDPSGHPSSTTPISSSSAPSAFHLAVDPPNFAPSYEFARFTPRYGTTGFASTVDSINVTHPYRDTNFAPPHGTMGFAPAVVPGDDSANSRGPIARVENKSQRSIAAKNRRRLPCKACQKARKKCSSDEGVCSECEKRNIECEREQKTQTASGRKRLRDNVPISGMRRAMEQPPSLAGSYGPSGSNPPPMIATPSNYLQAPTVQSGRSPRTYGHTIEQRHGIPITPEQLHNGLVGMVRNAGVDGMVVPSSIVPEGENYRLAFAHLHDGSVCSTSVLYSSGGEFLEFGTHDV